jgi:alpha-L-fucosidase 2
MVSDKNGYLVTSPSTSPENNWKKGINVCEGSTIELQIINDLYINTIAACKVLKVDNDFRKKLEAAKDKIRPMQIGSAGQLMEWNEDWDMSAPDTHHRHTSHLFGLFPGKQISPLITPLLANAAKKTLDVRGDDGTGWSLAWKINFWARLLDGDHAYKLIKNQLRLVTSSGTNYREGGTFPNLFDAHPPFQIDGNFGFVSGIDELLFQSQEMYENPSLPGKDLYVVDLLPALPHVWPTGSIRGVRVRGGFELGMEWKEGILVRASLKSIKGRSCTVRYGTKAVQVNIQPGKSIQMNKDLNILQ